MGDDARRLAEIEARWTGVGPWHMGVWSHGGEGGSTPLDWYVGDAGNTTVAHSPEAYSPPPGLIGRMVALLPVTRRREATMHDPATAEEEAECAKGEEDMRRIAAAPEDVAWLIAEVKRLRDGWDGRCVGEAVATEQGPLASVRYEPPTE